MYGSVIWPALDKIERQIRKNKTKIERRTETKFLLASITDALVVEDSDVAQAKGCSFKHIDLKPMDLEEALLQTDLIWSRPSFTSMLRTETKLMYYRH